MLFRLFLVQNWFLIIEETKKKKKKRIPTNNLFLFIRYIYGLPLCAAPSVKVVRIYEWGENALALVRPRIVDININHFCHIEEIGEELTISKMTAKENPIHLTNSNSLVVVYIIRFMLFRNLFQFFFLIFFFISSSSFVFSFLLSLTSSSSSFFRCGRCLFAFYLIKATMKKKKQRVKQKMTASTTT